VHNARNRWAALRSGTARGPGGGPAAPGYHDGDGRDSFAAESPHPLNDDAIVASGGTAGGLAPGDQGRGGGRGPAAPVREQSPFSSAKKRAGDLLEQARRQHAAALAGLRAERELYQRVGEELASLADPAALDLEIATVAARAGRQMAQAEQDAADARRAQLAAERERDEAARLRAAADDAAEQLTEDATEAERVLAERTAGFERDLADLVGRARAAEEAERAARDEGTAARAAAEASAAAARDRAEQATAALADALRGAEQARERAAQEVARARDQAAAAVAAAEERARQQAAAAQARADELAVQARADAERERESARQARDETARVRAEADVAREAARQAQAGAATAVARAGAAEDELARLRSELGRRDTAHAAELGRLAAAHQAALDAERALLGAERARARRAEDELAATRSAAK
jgi:colicin import membrane protein